MSDINSFHIYWRQVMLLDKGSNVFWTIQIEVIFYLCFVAIWGVAALSRSTWATASLLLVAAIVFATLGPTTSWTFFKVFHVFLLGVLSAMFNRRWARQVALGRWGSIVGLVLLLSIPFTFPKVFLALGGAEIDPWASKLVLLQLLLFFNVAVLDRRYLHALLCSPPLQWLGKVSYSLYLLHYFVLSAIVSWTVPKENYGLNFLLVFSAVCAVSWVANRYLERPIQRFTLNLPGHVKVMFKRLGVPGRAV